MKLFITVSALVVMSASFITGCASNDPYQTSTPYSTPYPSSTHSRNSDIGVIESIYVTHAEKHNSGTGAVVGAVVGGLVGNQIGNGNGKTAATAAGVIGGAVLGNNIEKNKNPPADIYEIRVHMNNGDSTNLMQDSIVNLHVGDRVRVVNGRVYLY